MKPEIGLEIQGRYELVERIAIGGMGEVWRATDLRSGRAVAAKILRPELTGDEIFLARLRAEAANSRGLRHPNLAVVLDAGERDGSGWIIMELVQGRPLSDILEERGTMRPVEILTIMAQVARALQVVHDSGVIYRDVKPSNILINREGLAKLTDFGISTAVHQRPMTATGMVMGTAQYLAPEQAMGNMATPSGDLYALGIIGYEALVGHRPFTGSTQVEIAFAHVNQEVPPIPGNVPREVRDVIMELLSKSPADRPASARELARRLDRIVINLPKDSWDPSEAPLWSSAGQGPAGRSSTPALGAGAQARPGAPAAARSASSGGEAPSRRPRSAPSAPARWEDEPRGADPRPAGRRAAEPSGGPGDAARRGRQADRDSPGRSADRTSRPRRPPIVIIAVVAVVALAIVLVVTLSTLAHAQPVSGHDDLVSPTSSKEAL